MDITTLAVAKSYTKEAIGGLWDKWSATVSYAKGQIVLREGIPYQANQQTTQGTWVASEWTQINISDQLEAMQQCIKIKGIVPYYKNLPTTGNNPLDAYLVAYEGETGSVALRREYVWFNGTGTYSWWSFEGNSARAVNGTYPDSNGNVVLSEVPYASNLTSDTAQTIYESFVERTSGGTASISDGDAWLSFVRGNSVHTGVQDASATGEVTTGEFTATINVSTFATAMTQYGLGSGTYPFTYTADGWKLNTTVISDMSLIGITITGTPAVNDVYTVTYTQASRGTITNANPTKFVSTGNNLYSNTLGYAKVAPYTGTYGITGTYTSIGFASTIGGTVTPITVTSGYFTTEGEAGYIYVTGGDATTMIWQCWSDMTTATFEAYAVSEITFPTLTICPQGLAKVGTAQDSINFDTGVATQEVGVLAYTAQNLATVIAMGVSYDCDENWIYYVLATPLTQTITTSGSYTVKDHGIEYFTGSSVAVYADTLYGENLKDKLRTDVVTISAQTLTTPQKEQVRKNIGAKSAYHVWGVDIDQNNSNPETSMTYVGDATTMTAGSTEWDNVFGAKPCLFVDGAVSCYLNPANYAQDESGNTVDITTLGHDVMVEFPKMGYKIYSTGDTISVRLTDEPDADGYCYKPFSRSTEGDKDKFYYGAYKAYDESGMMYSSSGKAPTASKTRAVFRSEARARGTGYAQNGWYQLVYLQVLYLLKYKNLDSQTALGQGYVGGSAKVNTGGTDAKGFNYGSASTTEQMKFLGIEDFWGNIWSWVDGYTTDASWNMVTTHTPVNFDDNPTGTDHKVSETGLTANVSGYIKLAQGDTDKGFAIKTSGGSSTTYWSDSGSLSASCVADFGGTWAYGAIAGVFLLRASYAASYSYSTISSRLMFV